jgi:hypothetical protein
LHWLKTITISRWVELYHGWCNFYNEHQDPLTSANNNFLANVGPPTLTLTSGKTRWLINLQECTQRNSKTNVKRNIFFGPAYPPVEISYEEPDPWLPKRQMDNQPAWKKNRRNSPGGAVSIQVPEPPPPVLNIARCISTRRVPKGFGSGEELCAKPCYLPSGYECMFNCGTHKVATEEDLMAFSEGDRSSAQPKANQLL